MTLVRTPSEVQLTKTQKVNALKKAGDVAEQASPMVRYMALRALRDQAQKLVDGTTRLAADLRDLGFANQPELKGIDRQLDDIEPLLERVLNAIDEATQQAYPRHRK